MKKVKPQNTISLIILLISAILYSCASKKNSIQNLSIQEKNPKLIFLNYTISKASNGKKKVGFLNKIITDGKLKNNSSKYLKTGRIGDLKCAQLDKKSNPIQSINIKNPLSKTFEYVNDSLIFEKRKIKLKSSPFSLRLQLNSRTEFIVISEIIDSLQNSKTLNRIKLD